MPPAKTHKRAAKPAQRAAVRPARKPARSAARKAPPKSARKPGPVYDRLEKQLVAVLEPFAHEGLDGPWPSKRWTQEIRARLSILGRELGYRVCAEEAPRADLPWLHSVTWLDERGGRLRAVALAVEIEWNLNLQEIAEDFDKLMQSRARRRLMLFAQRDSKDVAMVFARLRARARGFGATLPGDRYLLAGYAFDKRQFIFLPHSA